MIRTRSARTLATLVATASLALTAIVGPATVLASPPAGWSVTAVPLPSSVTPGNAAGYAVTVSNVGPSTLPQVFLTTETTNNPATVFVQGPGCDPAGTVLDCSLPQIKKNKSVTVIVAYATPTSGANFSITFEVNTTGATDSDGGGTSHGDTIRATATTTLSADATDFYGAFELLKKSVGNSQALSASNPQTTLVNLPEGAIAVTVQDGSGVPGICPTAFTCFGQISEIHVNQGAFYTGGFSVFIQWDKSLSPPSANSIDIWHEFDTPKPGPNNTLILGEDITNDCQFQGQSTTPKTIPCLQRLNLGSGNRGAIVWLLENGKTFGH